MNTSEHLICNPSPANVIHKSVSFSACWEKPAERMILSSSLERPLLLWILQHPPNLILCYLTNSIFKNLTLFCFMFSVRQSSTPIGPALGSPALKRFLRYISQSASSHVSQSEMCHLMSHQIGHCCLLLSILSKLWPIIRDPDPR